MPTFSREFKSFGIRKERIGGRTRYFDIALRSSATQDQNKDKDQAQDKDKSKKLAEKLSKAA